MKNYITNDITLAATLYIIMEEYPKVMYGRGNKLNPYFSFGASKEIEDNVIAYFEGKTKVEPKMLMNVQNSFSKLPTEYEDF